MIHVYGWTDWSAWSVIHFGMCVIRRLGLYWIACALGGVGGNHVVVRHMGMCRMVGMRDMVLEMY